MPDQPTITVTAAADAERHASNAPPLTLLAVILLWYVGVAGLVLSHVL